jgi:hypothetical protein
MVTIRFTFLWLAGLFAAAVGPAMIGETPISPSSTVAYVYVSYIPSGASANKIAAWSVKANGILSPIPGSPFVANVGSMAVNGKYLFGSNLLGVYVSSFQIMSNGALKWVHSKNVEAYYTSGCTYPGDLILDHSGAALYRHQTVGGLCDSTEYQSFMVDKSTGQLIFLGRSNDTFLYNTPLSFLKNDKYAYGTRCVNYEGFPTDTFLGYARLPGGLLENGGTSINLPATTDPTHFYCTAFTAADPFGHVAITMTDTDFNNPFNSPPLQIATYTADSLGNLTTTSTATDMPSVDAGYIFGLAMSNNGKLLAVGGNGGLQVFHFNGAMPATHYTGLLTSDSIDQMFWDHNHHLLALSKSAGKLYVFTVTGTSVTASPGSPYSITTPSNLIVQPLTDTDGDWDHD